MSLGEKLKAARLAAGMTQKQLGESCGIDAANIRKYESNRQNPKKETIIRICKELGVHPAEIDDSFAFDLGTDIMYMNSDGSAVKADSNTPAGAALDLLMILGAERLRQMRDDTAKLNDLGRDTAVQRIKELAEIPKYQRKPDKK